MYKMLMMNSPAAILLFVIQIRASRSTATQCDYFLTFPSLTGHVYTAEERSNISLDFRVESTSTDCPIPESFTVTVERQDKGYRQTQCTIKHLDGKCGIPLSQQNTCSCLPEDRHFQLTKVLEQADNTTWWWRLEGNDKQVIFERELVFYITSASDDSSTASWVTSEAPPEVPTAPPVGHGVDFTAIIIAGIAALALVVIAFRIFSAKRDNCREQCKLPHDTDDVRQTSLTLESRIHTGSNHESNYYWEIHDEPSSPSPGASVCPTGAPETLTDEPSTGLDDNLTPVPSTAGKEDPPRSCLRPAPPEDCLHPSESAEVEEGTDVTPFYENSELRPLELSYVTLGRSSSVMGAVQTQINVGTVSTPASTDFVRVANENRGPEETKVSAQTGAFENAVYGLLHDVSQFHDTLSEGSEWLSTSLENSC